MVGSNDENPTKSYFWDKKLYAYDYLLIIINNSVNESNLRLIKEIYETQTMAIFSTY